MDAIPLFTNPDNKIRRTTIIDLLNCALNPNTTILVNKLVFEHKFEIYALSPETCASVLNGPEDFVSLLQISKLDKKTQFLLDAIALETKHWNLRGDYNFMEIMDFRHSVVVHASNNFSLFLKSLKNNNKSHIKLFAYVVNQFNITFRWDVIFKSCENDITNISTELNFPESKKDLSLRQIVKIMNYSDAYKDAYENHFSIQIE